MGRRIGAVGQLAVGGLLLSVMVPVEAAAQGWTRLPNGGYAYATDYTTSGVFTCGRTRYQLTGSCRVSGNSVILESATGSVTTVSFTGVTGTLVATGKATRFPTGTMQVTHVGTTPPHLPTFKSPAEYVFSFSLIISTAPPYASSGGFWHRFWSRPAHLSGGRTGVEVQLATAPAPSPYLRPLRVFDATDFDLPLADASVDMSADATITPEPATIVLFASGLAGVAGALRRRRRTPAADGPASRSEAPASGRPGRP